MAFFHSPMNPRSAPIPPPISLILLSRIIMLPFMLLGHAHGAVSELGFPLSETKPSHPSPSPPLPHLCKTGTGCNDSPLNLMSSRSRRRNMPSLADSDVVSSLPCFSGACPPPRVESAASMRGELGLGEGRSNHNFIVTTSDGRRFFVRLGDDLPAFGVSRAHEHAAAQAAAAAGVGPVVIFASLHHCALVFELIEGGKALTEEEIRSATSSEGGKALTEEEIRSATSSDQDDTSADDQSAGDQSVDERHGECNCQPRSEGGTDARSLSKSLSKRSSSLLESIAAILVRLHRTPPPLALLEDSDAAADASSSSATTLGTPSGGGGRGRATGPLTHSQSGSLSPSRAGTRACPCSTRLTRRSLDSNVRSAPVQRAPTPFATLTSSPITLWSTGAAPSTSWTLSMRARANLYSISQ